jgi:hypothetical protein
MGDMRFSGPPRGRRNAAYSGGHLTKLRRILKPPSSGRNSKLSMPRTGTYIRRRSKWTGPWEEGRP